jgi:hypothetical protein
VALSRQHWENQMPSLFDVFMKYKYSSQEDASNEFSERNTFTIAVFGIEGK